MKNVGLQLLCDESNREIFRKAVDIIIGDPIPVLNRVFCISLLLPLLYIKGYSRYKVLPETIMVIVNSGLSTG